MKYIKKVQDQRRALHTLNAIGAKENISPESVALTVVRNRLPEVHEYIKQFGIEPAENAAAAAVQATIIHEDRILQKQQSGVPNYNEAEASVFQDEEEEMANNVSASFLGGSLIASITKAGKAGIEALNKKRLSKGRKPFFSDKGWQNLKRKVDGKINVKLDDEGFSIAGKLPKQKEKTEDEKNGWDKVKEAVTGSLTEDAQKEWLNKNLPFILLAVVAVYFLLQKK